MRTKMLPGEIERASMEIIARELAQRDISIPPEQEAVVKRVIHTTADFDFAQTLRFSEHAVALGVASLKNGTNIVTDTNMARSGVSRPSLEKLGGQVFCYMADADVAQAAKTQGTTRAAAAMEKMEREQPGAILAVGNAPTALLELAEQIEGGLRPALVIAAPVGFVNVVESKERIWKVCLAHQVPIIAAMGRKGGSTVAAAICNALLYTAVGREV
ncbi:precorrin-8X methylmutase [Lawsonibacter sp. LCP25S3_G6]|uniref:precorrin-8X methylmutase n=1 Tax=unclassified Lawsonibacter TaxID=2617946 RepID=UPI003F94F98F